MNPEVKKRLLECGYDYGFESPRFESSDTYPDFIRETVEKGIAKIKKAENENTFTFAFMTDIHYLELPHHDVLLARNANAYRQIEKEIEDLRNLSVKLKEESARSKEEIASLQKKRSETEERSASLRISQRQKSDEREKISGEIARLEERKAVMVKDYDDTVNKLYDEYQLTKREAEAICEKPEEPRKAQQRLSELKNSIRALGSVNVSAIEEYKEVKERYEFMNAQVTDVERSKKELLSLIDELTDKMSKQFREQFIKINQNFGETFSELFGGGC